MGHLGNGKQGVLAGPGECATRNDSDGVDTVPSGLGLLCRPRVGPFKGVCNDDECTICINGTLGDEEPMTLELPNAEKEVDLDSPWIRTSLVSSFVSTPLKADSKPMAFVSESGPARSRGLQKRWASAFILWHCVLTSGSMVPSAFGLSWASIDMTMIMFDCKSSTQIAISATEDFNIRNSDALYEHSSVRGTSQDPPADVLAEPRPVSPAAMMPRYSEGTADLCSVQALPNRAQVNQSSRG